eukprot:2298236-Pleurochrysis_carterae.AAC.6
MSPRRFSSSTSCKWRRERRAFDRMGVGGGKGGDGTSEGREEGLKVGTWRARLGGRQWKERRRGSRTKAGSAGEGSRHESDKHEEGESQRRTRQKIGW